MTRGGARTRLQLLLRDRAVGDARSLRREHAVAHRAGLKMRLPRARRSVARPDVEQDSFDGTCQHPDFATVRLPPAAIEEAQRRQCVLDATEGDDDGLGGDACGGRHPARKVRAPEKHSASSTLLKAVTL